MAGRVLTISQYLGGADNVKCINWTPWNQDSFTYNFSTLNISGWTFSADFQSILLDEVTYDRTDGNANFTNTNVIGSFANLTPHTDWGNIANVTTPTGGFIDTSNQATGLIVLTIPSNRYTGPMFINARTNVVATIVSFQWKNADYTSQGMHRYCVLERYEPGAGVGDPRLSTDPQFTALSNTVPA